MLKIKTKYELNANGAHIKIDFTSDVRAPRNPGIVPAYFHIYRHVVERYGIADILGLLRLLLPCLCAVPVSV